ncbi:MAG: hypothetical protein WA905_08405, partial [Pseudolabrys sp.]
GSARQCDEQGADAHENPGTGLSLNVQFARWGRLPALLARLVRFGSKADMCSAQADVRFTPKADMCSAQADVRFVPIADI